MSDAPSPLALATTEELLDELERRTSFVVCYLTEDDTGSGFTLRSSGPTMTQVGMAHHLSRHIDLVADTKHTS